jgi:circadian clock protein KaiC
MSPAEFAHHIGITVEEQGAQLVAVDSLTGYVNVIAQERRLLVQMHELLTYLTRLGVLSLFTVAQHGLLDPETDRELDISYLADAVILLRHFEGIGHVRQAITVLKKRHSSHEKTIRELLIGPDGVQVGETLEHFRHVLSGRPLIPSPGDLFAEQEDHEPDENA